MKKNMILACLLAAAMCACTNDDNLADMTANTADSAAPVYMKFGISLPTTRSTTSTTDEDDYVTSDAGIEYGKDYENEITHVLVVLTSQEEDKSGEVVVAATDDNVTPGDNDNEYVVGFENSLLEDHKGEKVDVYVYCNPTTDFINKIAVGEKLETDAYYTLTSETDDRPWQENHFMMSNAKVVERTMPTELSTNPDEPTDLGTIEVERSCARFDYKDGSANSDLTYTVGTLYGETDTEVSITLTDVALVNMSKQFYLLRRTAESSDSTEGAETADLTEANIALLGVERSTNWVIDTDAEAKSSYDGTSDLSDNFVYPLFSGSGDEAVLNKFDDFEWSSLSEIVNGDKDNDDSWNNESSYGDYYIWRYATENTIPSVAAQKNGISTGVAFRGEITWDGQEEVTASSGTIYALGTVIYGSWDDVAKAADADDGSAVANAYAQVMAVADNMEGDFSETDATVVKAMAEAGFTGYAPEEGNDGNYHYYAYYYYWNRHNDNSDNAMGVMEFGVVRNNVYKLSVTEISKFGHPTPGGDTPDPDEPTPDEDDETTTYYFKLTVEILPWVVRLNDISF